MRAWIVVAVLLGAVGSARADGMWCGGRLVSVGERNGEVLLKCGAPTVQERREELRSNGDVATTVSIDTWTYNLGPQSFVRILTFVNGVLQSIELGGRGR